MEARNILKFLSSIDVCVTSDADMYMYLSSLVLKPRHLSGSAFCRCEQALGGIALDFGIIVDDKLHVEMYVLKSPV